MTRTDDGFVSLADRVKIARDNQAALLISIHADFLSKREGDARGATVYTVSDRASDAEAARLAMSICSPGEDQRGNAEYKTAMAGEMTQRALRTAQSRAK